MFLQCFSAKTEANIVLFIFLKLNYSDFFKSCSLEYYELEFVQYDSFNIVSVVFFIVNERLSLTRLNQSYHFLQSFAFDVIFCMTPDNSYNIIRSYVYLEEKKSTITNTGQSFV